MEKKPAIYLATLSLTLIAVLCASAISVAFAAGESWSIKAALPHPLEEVFATAPGVGVQDGKIYAVSRNFDIARAITAYLQICNTDKNTWT